MKRLDKAGVLSSVSCVRCGARHVKVSDSRPIGPGRGRKWRRRVCAKCGHKWSTIEVPAKDLARLERTARALGAALDFMEFDLEEEGDNTQ